MFNNLLHTPRTSPSPAPGHGGEQGQSDLDIHVPIPTVMHIGCSVLRSVIVEDLVRVLQYGVDDTDLPSCVRDVGTCVRTHQCRAVRYKQV
jgi:hypothetical protein